MILSSRRFLKLFSDGAVFRSTESRFHFWITLYEKKFCRCLLPFVANSFTRRAPFLACLTSQNADGSIRVIPFRILKTLMRSPQSLRCCSVMRPSIFLLSSEFFDFNPYTRAVAFDCTDSSILASADVLGGQAAIP